MSLFKLTTLMTLSHRRIRPMRSFYDWRTRTETIFALATSIQPVKGSPLGIIRVSGANTSQTLQQLTRLQPLLATSDNSGEDSQDAFHEKALSPRHATLAKIVEPQTGDLIDIGLVLWFPKPGSYTGEDTCEFHVHGSQAIIKRLMTILGQLEGLRPAEPGEFTRRAVENGKISLMQAESIPELIAAQTDEQRRLALKGLSGSTRAKYNAWIERLINILAHLEASIDFGEDELIGEQRVVNECIKNIARLACEITQFVTLASRCRDFARAGARMTILGRPNAGKSTLMNLLCRQEKSIVSDLSGTTRDIIEHSFDFDGHTITLCDTAGLRKLGESLELNKEPPDGELHRHMSIEREGIKRALQDASKADLVLYTVDGGDLKRAISDEELVAHLVEELTTIKENIESKVLHIIINKMDLNTTLNAIGFEQIQRKLGDTLKVSQVQISLVSCKTEANLGLLTKRISESLERLRPMSDDGGIQLEYANERHLALLRSTLMHLERASQLELRNIDEMAQHVRESVDYLSRIVGSVSNEQVFDVIFRDFCIGK